MKVEVEYTAQLKVKTGVSADSYELDEGARVSDLIKAVAAQHDIAEFLPSSLLCFVGGTQADDDQSLSDGDSVTLLSPISGG
ncbi:MAG: MoaD/ThiS family protein [Kiritimatiellia bacterium]|jgi:molybdopterin converting factor small subunit|nr:MoaD/ThiS family protein [Kiritimatiellia bacterium]MDP6631068.1 MoaD/ThiS family protein [Kiritimatiellia bacterium]MDP6810024.1 MoaD/ThiS family protein [Kiritimatiellia bacterium]MDP7024795.1 MoaD/ThiS family protein [Kiritimatiellia bacterium]